MASIHYVILFSIVYLYVYALICRICKCIEHCATARAYSKLRENGVMTKMSDVEAGQISQDDVQPAGGHVGRQGDAFFRRAQGDGLKAADDAVAHLAGGGIGEGDGQDLIPARGAGAQPAGGGSGRCRGPAGRQQTQKTPGQVIGLA